MIDIGRGTTLVVIPGIQGRWEWMRPMVDRLAEHHRVVCFSFCDERTSSFTWDRTLGFENYLRQVDAVMRLAALQRAVLVGVSYGGLVATEFAARFPDRVSGLILASALPADWTPDARAAFYMRAPRLLSPLFVATAPHRLQPEVRAAFPHLGDRLRFMLAHGLRVARAPMSPSKMARRARWARDYAFADPASVSVPTLVVTGEPGLDRVVPVEVSRRSVARMPGARHVVLPHTGHLGVVTRPERFATLVDDFLSRDPDAGATHGPSAAHAYTEAASGAALMRN